MINKSEINRARTSTYNWLKMRSGEKLSADCLRYQLNCVQDDAETQANRRIMTYKLPACSKWHSEFCTPCIL